MTAPPERVRWECGRGGLKRFFQLGCHCPIAERFAAWACFILTFGKRFVKLPAMVAARFGFAGEKAALHENPRAFERPQDREMHQFFSPIRGLETIEQLAMQRLR